MFYVAFGVLFLFPKNKWYYPCTKTTNFPILGDGLLCSTDIQNVINYNINRKMALRNLQWNENIILPLKLHDWMEQIWDETRDI